MDMMVAGDQHHTIITWASKIWKWPMTSLPWYAKRPITAITRHTTCNEQAKKLSSGPVGCAHRLSGPQPLTSKDTEPLKRMALDLLWYDPWWRQLVSLLATSSKHKSAASQIIIHFYSLYVTYPSWGPANLEGLRKLLLTTETAVNRVCERLLNSCDSCLSIA